MQAKIAEEEAHLRESERLIEEVEAKKMAKDRETVLKYNPEGVVAEADKVLAF